MLNAQFPTMDTTPINSGKALDTKYESATIDYVLSHHPITIATFWHLLNQWFSISTIYPSQPVTSFGCHCDITNSSHTDITNVRSFGCHCDIKNSSHANITKVMSERCHRDVKQGCHSVTCLWHLSFRCWNCSTCHMLYSSTSGSTYNIL